MEAAQPGTRDEPRVEYFLIEDLVALPAAGKEAPPAGAMVLRLSHSENGVLLEREVSFRSGPMRVLHVEEPQREHPRLVWR